MATRLCKGTSPRNGSSSDKERGQWKRPVEYVLSTVGYAVGMGSLYRFPYLAMRNGGGAFLIAFIFFMITCGFPLFFMESALGQYYKLSPLKIFNICPLFNGVGYAMCALSTAITVYCMTLIVWVLYYIYASFNTILPWTTCGNDWNTDSCIPLHEWNISDNLGNISSVKGNSSTEQFWERNVLGLSSGIDEIGGIQPALAICLSIAWFMIFVCLCKGIASSRIVVYVTATAPFVLLFILMIRCAILPGSLNGVLYYITPRWERIADPLTWLEAFLAVFYSLGPGWGGLITLASYNPRSQNCFRDAVIVTVADTVTAIFCGFVVFSILGYMAEEAGVDVADVVNVGPGLAFVTYPYIVATLPIPQLWAAMFFLLVLFLGVDSQFGSLKTLTSGLCDLYPVTLGQNKAKFTLVICICGNIIGLIFITKGGMYMFQIMDWYFSVFTLPVIAFIECMIIGWIYGPDRFLTDIRQMMPYIHRHTLTALKYTWRFFIPPLMVIALVFTCVRFKPPKLGDYVYPNWTEGLGWTLALSSFILIPAIAGYEILRGKGTLRMRIAKLLKSRLPPVDIALEGKLGTEMSNFEQNQKLMNGDGVDPYV